LGVPRKRAVKSEASRAASGDKYKMIFDSINDGVFIHDPDTGAILEANRKVTEMYGYTPDEIRAITIEDLSSGTAPYTQEGAIGKIRAAVEQGGLLFEWHCRDKAGRLFWVEVNFKPMALNGKLRVVATVRNITRRKKAEDTLRESEERYRAVFENTAEGIIITDPTGPGRVLSVNGAACDMFGYTREEFLGLDRESLVTTDGPDAGVLMEQGEKTGRATALLVYKRKDGSRFLGDMSSTIFRDSAGNLRAVSIVRDVTDRRRAEEVLRTSEERYRTLYNSMSQGVMEFDGNGSFVSANRTARDILGLDFSGMEGMQLQEMLGKSLDDSDKMKTANKAGELAFIHTQLTGKAMKSRKARVMNARTGEYRWVLMDSFPMFGPGNAAPSSVFLIFSDVTELMKTQEELEMAKIELESRVKIRAMDLKNTNQKLEEQKELLQTIIDHIPVIVTLCDSHGKIRLVNKEFEKLTGWSLNEKNAREVAAGCFPDLPYRREIVDIIATAKPGWHEFDVTTRSGNTLRILWASVRLSEGHIGIGIDITERKKMQEDLLRLAAAVDQTGEAVVLRSPEGMVEYVNPAFERISGYSRDEVVGRKAGSPADYFAGHDIGEILGRVAKEGKPWAGRQTRKRKTGETICVDVFISPVRDAAGRIINLISLIRDVTQEVRMQQQLAQVQRMDAIGNLAGGIAHDLKNILTPILMNTEMALEDVGESSPARPALEDALSAAKLGRDLVQQILTFSRRVPHQKAPVDIPEVIRDTVRFLRSTLPSTIEIRNELKDDRVMAYADPTQIKQVLINLGTNAGHAMKDPGGILDVSESTAVLNEQEAARISPDLAPGPYVLVEVQDTGQGMDEDTIKHIFEPFFTTKKGEGLGLGLAVAHGIVKEHQGAITVKSNRGEGTTFTVFLPVLGEKPDKGLS